MVKSTRGYLRWWFIRVLSRCARFPATQWICCPPRDLWSHWRVPDGPTCQLPPCLRSLCSAGTVGAHPTVAG
ncbi:hypothetical protein ACFFX0_31340 [Citricoccus parietis]|uniref:Secreted protein n=1 Tax=Citricoccus parietis TaxID=592307 RepID=A0ABV5G8Y2_9MICC